MRLWLFHIVIIAKWVLNGVSAGAVKAVQHLLNEIGYVGTKLGDKSEDLAAVAMEMSPDEVQWLKVLIISMYTFTLISLSPPFLS